MPKFNLLLSLSLKKKKKILEKFKFYRDLYYNGHKGEQVDNHTPPFGEFGLVRDQRECNYEKRESAHRTRVELLALKTCNNN